MNKKKGTLLLLADASEEGIAQNTLATPNTTQAAVSCWSYISHHLQFSVSPINILGVG